MTEKPIDWVSVLTPAKPLNKALKRCHYPMATIDDLLPSLTEAKVFSVCDVENGFWHVVLDDASSRLTTFGTPCSGAISISMNAIWNIPRPRNFSK